MLVEGAVMDYAMYETLSLRVLSAIVSLNKNNKIKEKHAYIPNEEISGLNFVYEEYLRLVIFCKLPLRYFIQNIKYTQTLISGKDQNPQRSFVQYFPIFLHIALFHSNLCPLLIFHSLHPQVVSI